MVRLYKNFNISKNHKGSIILIGNFDGVHLGHQKLFKLAESYKKKYNLKVGDLITIKKKQIHAFTTNDGAIIEELSTTHIKEDTYYLDKKINANKNRKSFIYL